MKKYPYLVSLGLLLVCLMGILLLSGCASPLQATDLPETIWAGDTHQLALTYQGEKVSANDYYYASEDPTVATVTEWGEIIGVRQGETSIHLQHKEDASIKASFDVAVAYHVVDEEEVFHTNAEILQNGYSDTDHPFFERNGYEMRMDDWDILSIVKLVADKGEDDYAFTDMYRSAMANNETFMVLSDWGNEDVVIDPLVLTNVDLSQYLVAKEGYTYDGFAKVGEDIAMQSIKSKINPKLQNLGYAVKCSDLSDEYEYRVSIKVGYHVYRTVNYYSRGLVGGGWNVILDLVKLDISSFLNSYTYSEECYEVVLDSCQLVIEKRPKTTANT